VEFAAKPGTTGTDFLGQIQEGSNRFLRRLAGFTASIPGIIWEDLKKIRAETKALFTGEPRAAPGEPGSDAPSFVDRAMTSWPILAGIVLLVILAPFIGLDNVFTGFLAAVALAVAGFWVLAVGAILVGYLMDDNAPGEGNFVQSLLLTGYLKGGDVKGAYPKVFSGVLLFIATAIVAGVLAWLGHNHLATIALLLGGAIVIFVISTGARDPKGKLRPSRLGVLPAVVMLFLGAAMAVWMAILGFAGYAWVFLFFSTVLALMAVYSMIGTAFWGQKKAKAHVDQPLEESRKGLKWAWGRLKDNDHTQASVGAWGELGFWAKFVVWISALGVWLAAVAFGSGQFLLGGIYTVVTLFLLAIVFEIFIPRFMVQLRGEHAAAEEAIAE
jgi:MFS family permease